MAKSSLLYTCLGVIFVLFFITGCGGGGGIFDFGDDDNTPNPSATSTPQPNPSGRDWTYMIYMGADNNLSDAGLQDLNEMEMVGSTGDVAIVLQAEFSTYYSGGVPSSTMRFYVQNDGNNSDPDLNAGQSIGNVDMASPATLTGFIQWAAATYPANNYALILWDHGDGWRTRAQGGAFKGAIQDETSGTFMSLPDIAEGVRNSGIHMDIINFDACLMAMYEVAYEFNGLTDYMVFSEETEPGDGDPYDTILGDLVLNPGMSASVLSVTTVNRYDSFYEGSRQATTLSAVDMSKLSALDSKVRAFANTLMDGSENTEVSNAQLQCQAYYETSYRDLYDFCQSFIAQNPSGDAATAAQEVMTAVSQMVIANKVNSTGETDLSGSYGLSIYIPQSNETTSSELATYSLLACNLARASGAGTWGAYVEEFVGAGGGGTATYGPGGFEIRIEWTGDSDVDLWVREPKAGGGEEDFASGYTGQSTPNGTFSPDSYISGNTVEYYQAKDNVYTGDYYFAVTYYGDGSYSTSADVTVSILDPANGVNNWQTVTSQVIDSSYTTSDPWWVPLRYNVTGSNGEFIAGSIDYRDKDMVITVISDKK